MATAFEIDLYHILCPKGVEPPCRLCHVVIVVGLVYFDDHWGYAIEALMPTVSWHQSQLTNSCWGKYF